jgi:AraC family transcriptional regulator
MSFRYSMLNTDLLAASLRCYAPARELQSHSHALPRLCYVLRGNFQESIEGKQYARRRGMMLYRPAGLNHAEQFGRNGSMCGLITPPTDWLALTTELGFQLYERRTAHGADAMRLVQIFEREWSLDDSFSALSLQAVLWESMSFLGCPERDTEHRVSIWALRALEYLHNHNAASISLSQIASDLGVHRGHLAKVFRAAYGETLGARLRRIRVQRAAALIRGTKVSLVEIAARCGFAHQAHMTRVFRSVLGVTPARYRR